MAAGRSRLMRILFLNHNYRYMATFNRARPMAQALARRGHTCTVLTVSPKNRWRATWSEVDGITIGEMPNLGQNFSGEGYGPIDNLRRIGHALSQRYDVIHALDHKPNASFGGVVGRLRGATLIGDWVDWWGGPGGINDVPKRRVPAIGAFENWWEVRSKQIADGVVTISTVLRDRALAVGIPADNVFYMPNGTEPQAIKPIPAAQARQALGLPVDRPYIGFLGMSMHDLKIIVRAMHSTPALWLMAIGKASSLVMDEARACGVADRVWQTGFVPDEKLSDYFGVASMCGLPLYDTQSNRGRMPGKLMYYLAAGRAVVASRVSDAVQIITANNAGVICDDEAAFGPAIQALLDDPARADARAAAENVYAWDKLAPGLEAFYLKIRAAKSAHRSANSEFKIQNSDK
jgi:glycosyltransferase involved in cell wall biosynthesis